MPADNRDPRGEFDRAHIPDARFFDIDAISDPNTDLPHMMPSAEQFEQAVSELGIGNRHKIVVYDGAGMFSAARVWWMFRTMGHSEVFVLEGGLPAWQRSGHPVTDQETEILPASFKAEFDATRIAHAEELLTTTAQIADARAKPRFEGTVPEPRAGLRSGHIPGSVSVCFKDLLDQDQKLLPDDELRAVFNAAGVNIEKPVITSCGSGVTAAVLDLALTQLGAVDTRLYDGSWSEWGGRSDLPVETN